MIVQRPPLSPARRAKMNAQQSDGSEPPLRTLPESYPRRQYASRKGQKKPKGLHWGQRKLLMSEIEFLTLHGWRAKHVVYAGSAPGNHITLLSEMFPQHHFILVDPRDFAISASSTISLFTQFFGDNLAKDFKAKYSDAGQPLLFISDIRTGLLERHVYEDMQEQARWHRLIGSEASMLKFRLPWTKGTTM